MRTHDSINKNNSKILEYVSFIWIGLGVGCSTTDEPAECRDLVVEEIDMLKPTPLGRSPHELQMQITGKYTELLRWNTDSTKTMLTANISGRSDQPAKLIIMGQKTSFRAEDNCPKFRVVIPANIIIQTEDQRLDESMSGEFEFYSNDIAELVPQFVNTEKSESSYRGEFHLSVAQDQAVGAIFEKLDSINEESVSHGGRLIAEFGNES